MNTLTSRSKMLSSIAIATNILCVACESGFAVELQGTVDGVQNGQQVQPLLSGPTGSTGGLVEPINGTVEVSVVWGHNRNFEGVDFDSTRVDEDGEFRLSLPDVLDRAHLVPLEGGVYGATASIELTVDGIYHASADQTLIFVSDDVVIPGSDLGPLTAGYHLIQTNANGEREATAVDGRITIDVNSPSNCIARLYPELNACEELAESEQGPEASDAARGVCVEAFNVQVENCDPGCITGMCTAGE
jgi:hypothetical protein